jgi:H+/Cl- antiporter ClcA
MLLTLVGMVVKTAVVNVIFKGEEMKEDTMIILAMIIASTISFLLGFNISACEIKKQAIKHNYAEYNSKTGDWQWKGVNNDRND